MRKNLKQLDDQLAEVLLNLQHSLSTTKVFRRHYKILHSFNHPEGCCKENFHFQDESLDILERIEESLLHYTEQTMSLNSRVRNTSDLVSDSLLLQQISTRLTPSQVSNMLELNNTSTLSTLAKAAAKESESVQKLTMKATQDAAAVKVLSVLTLIYLPFTVVLVKICISLLRDECRY